MKPRRCDIFDLPTDTCAHCQGHHSVEETIAEASARRARSRYAWIPAPRPGTCGNCRHPYGPGTPIRRHKLCGWVTECCQDVPPLPPVDGPPGWKADRPTVEPRLQFAIPARRDSHPAPLRSAESPDPAEALRQAAELVILSQFASESMLQRKLHTSRHATRRILAAMYKNGIVGPRDKHGKRPVLIGPDYLEEAIAVLTDSG